MSPFCDPVKIKKSRYLIRAIIRSYRQAESEPHDVLVLRSGGGTVSCNVNDHIAPIYIPQTIQ